MKKDNSTNTPSEPLGVWNDPELEVRLIAMLTGELSPFEEAEMELELARSPELRLFRDRMLKVMGLITEVNQEPETEQDHDDDQWSISHDRRALLLGNFAVYKNETEPAEIESISTASIQWRNLSSIAACFLISCATFMVLFFRKNEAFFNTQSLVSYSASEESVIAESSQMKVTPGNPTNFETRNVRGLIEDEKIPSPDEIIIKPEMSNQAVAKPAAPSSSNAKVIAAGTPSSILIPVPNVSVNEPSLGFGNGDDYGDGWGNGGKDRSKNERLAGKGKQVSDHDSLQDDPFGDGLFISPIEGEKVNLEPRSQGSLADLKTGGMKKDLSAELLVKGNRSGDLAITRDNIDSFLNGPNRSAGKVGTEIPILDPTNKTIDFHGKTYSTMDSGLIGQRSASTAPKDATESDLRVKSDIVLNANPTPTYTGAWMSHAAEGKDAGRYAYNVEDNSEKIKSWLAAGQPSDSDITLKGDRQNSGSDDTNSLISKEIARRELLINEADEKILDGRKANSDKDYETAVTKYNEALNLLPPGPVAGGKREAYTKDLVDSSLALSEQYRRTGKYDEAKKLLEDVQEKDLGNVAAKKQLEHLNNPIRTSATLSNEHVKNIEKVRKQLYRAKSYYDQGKIDQANEEYKEVLRTDPHNVAAKRGMEKVNTLKNDYNKSAYDQARAEMLMKVDSTSKIAVSPAEIKAKMEEASDQLADAQRKVKLLKLMLSKPATEEYSAELFGAEAGNIDKGALKEAEEDLKLAEKKFAFAENLETMNTEGNVVILESKRIMKPAEKSISDFTQEISASENTHSTFSLNVSDVSFQLAKTLLLEKGGMPEAEKIRVEEFVNAFDYGDPSASDKKVNCVVEQCAHPYFQQRNLVRIGMKTGAIGRSQPLRLTVLLDNSGSMEREDRAASVVKAMEALASQLGPQDEINLLSFARDTRLVAQKIKGNEAIKLAEIVKKIPSEGGTNLSKAIEQAYRVAEQSVQKDTMSRIVIITDGAANLGNADPEDLSKSIEQMRQKGIAFDACGIGADELGDDMLEALTRKGDGRYYFINRPEDADAGFAQKIAGALRPAAKNVKVQVVFNPERVGNYRLIGFEKHRLETEDFRNDAVDAAEMAAEEAGNALYQVEAKPDGKGEIATVFVRFQDMESGEMVERSWAIPYQPNVASVASAAPSMQLATIAGMLGERLKYGDQAGGDFKELRPVYQEVRSHFFNDQDAQDLIRMCEKLNQ